MKNSSYWNANHHAVIVGATGPQHQGSDSSAETIMSGTTLFRTFWIPAALIAVAFPAFTAGGGGCDTCAGKFDFYVLSLSWSPSFCDMAGDRAVKQPECGERRYSFVVHGLWPQYEKGFPQSCLVPAPRLPRNIMESMLDLMPAPRLIYHEWDQHGTCSGLSPAAYFETVRKARAAVKIPPEYADLKSELRVKPEDVKSAFIKTNPGLTASSVAVDCDNRLREIRICLSKNLTFRDCPEIARRSCRRDEVIMPPVRGGGT
jgi:ribonuclease T2